MIKACICDFDGTLVTIDMLSHVAALVDKKEESEELNARFQAGEIPGVGGLVQRINFLEGIALTIIADHIKKNTYLTPGTVELFTFCQEQGIRTIIASGCVEQILQVYQDLLGVDHIVGPQPSVVDGCMGTINADAIPPRSFKRDRVQAILQTYGISSDESVVVGDSRADQQLFEHIPHSFAINPKGGIEAFASKVIEAPLTSLVDEIVLLNHAR